MGWTEHIIVFLTFLANVSIGIASIKKNPRSWTHRFLTILAFVFALWAVANYIPWMIVGESGRLFWVRITMMITSLIGMTTFLLAYVFPDDKLVMKRGWLAFFVIVGVSNFLLSPFTFSSLNNLPDGGFLPVPNWPMMVFALNHYGFTALGIIVLIVKYRKSVGIKKKQLGWMLAGILLTLFLITASNFVAVTIFKTVRYTFIGPTMTIIEVAFILYAIVKHRFLDITALVARTVAFTLLIGVVVGVEVASVLLVTKILPFDVDQTVVAVSASVLIILGYDPLRRVITKLTEKIFYKGRYNTEELLSELTHIMAGTIEIKKLSKTLLMRMTEELKLTWAGIVLVRDNEIVGVESVGQEKGRLYDPKLKDALCSAKEEMYVFEDLTDEVMKELFREKNLAVAIPLKVKKKEVGLLLLGPKASGDVVSGQDRQFLEILAPQAAVAVNNARSYREIQQFSKTLEKKVEERTEELQVAQKRELARADELLKIKDEFVFIASHDLAAPVTAITGYIDLLRMSKAKVSKQVRDNLEAIEQASGRLKNLVDDLLQVARGESGMIKVKLVDIGITSVVEKSIRMVEGRARKKKIKIVKKVPKRVGKVRADEDKLSEVMENLLTNAVKYGQKNGEVVVRVRSEGSWIVIVVEDDGIGIPKMEQKKVFTKFFRSETRETRAESGTGLGLFVAKMLVTKMKGKISFESEEGKGTKFVVRLKKVVNIG